MPPTLRTLASRALSRAAPLALLPALLAGPGAAGAVVTGADSTGAARATRVERGLLDAGLENVSVDAGSTLRVAYENRRYRHSADALGTARAAAAEPIVAFERRLGQVTAAIETVERDSQAAFRVRFPSDRDFPAAPSGRALSSTFRRADLDLGALVDYRVGELFDPFQVHVDLEPRLLLNPWPGAAIRLGVLFPLQNDFTASDQSPDLNRVRPGRMSLDQFFWLPGLALGSVSGGYFGDNRWGFAAGAARPLAEGAWLLDAQIERTGLLAFPADGTEYSTLDLTSGYAGVTYRPPFADVSVRVRAAQFLYGDRGVDAELRRSFGDLEVGYFAQRIEGQSLYGVRLDIPVPPLRRAAGVPLRVEPVPRFALSFRDNSEPAGTFVTGIASREEHLRQLSRPALDANADRYERALGGHPGEPPAGGDDWVSITGMTGFINTPWAGTIPDRAFETGYNFVPKRWAYDHRGTNDNQVFYATLGFLPHFETALRWTRIPGYHSFQELVPDSKLVDMDRMASARLELLPPRPGRPGLSAGIEDAEGTRRFHSTYVVTGLPFSILALHGRAGLGYGFRAFTASRYVLDGAFGAFELSPLGWLRAQLEYDSEKWNTAVGVSPGAGFRIRAALLNLQSLSLGAGWSHAL